ncbi:MAG: hypothetical protein JW929_08480 [Anaerolineales bacterium]|nr:hypothetical protein [Anaerolineales bacterium]
MNADSATNPQFPVKLRLAPVLACSWAIVIGMAVMSAAGLLFPSAVYPSDEFRKAFLPNDAANLIIGLPILLGSMAFAARGKLAGLLLWLGALLYIFYNYLIYFFSMPLDSAIPAYLLLVLLCGYALLRLRHGIDGEAVRNRLAGAVPERLAGGVLAVLGALYLFLAAGKIVASIVRGPLLTDTELALNLTDLAVSPLWILGGVMLWRRKAAGYAFGLGLLFSLSMLFVGLIFVFLLEPSLTGSAFRAADTLVILAMSLIVFVPFFLFLRGVVRSDRSSPKNPVRESS